MDAVKSQSRVETLNDSAPETVRFSRGHRRLVAFLFLCWALGCEHLAFCQERSRTAATADRQVPGAATAVRSEPMERKIPIDFIHDQKDIWTSPLKLRRKDLFWIVPSGIL